MPHDANLSRPDTSAPLSNATQDLHAALLSLREELEAIDVYGQRAESCTDASLRTVFQHNRDEEVEHAMMLLEWIRRTNPTFDVQARRYLFTDTPITQSESAMKTAPPLPSRLLSPTAASPAAASPAAASPTAVSTTAAEAASGAGLGVGSLLGAPWIS